MKRYDMHLFVCENKRTEGHPRGCCADKNSLLFRDKLKEKTKKSGLSVDIRVNGSGCLDACEFGIVLVIYPEGIWYGRVTEGDIDEIIESHLRNGKPVKRLLIEDKRYNRDVQYAG